MSQLDAMTQKKVWIDTDLSVGMKEPGNKGYCDVDDGYAVLQLMYANSIEIKGISAVFGNTAIENAYTIAQFMSRTFSSNVIPVYQGASEALRLDKVETNEAVEALAAALRLEPLTVLAIGPATNIGLLLLVYPELGSRIIEVVLVAGRRTPTDYFTIGNKGNHARDLNFDLDNDAFQVLLESKVAVVLCPFEISNKVWLKQPDIDSLNDERPGNQWLAQASQAWLQQWENQGASGFNPFDVLASHYLIAPQDIKCETLNARLEIHSDDTKNSVAKNGQKQQGFKQYLLCGDGAGFPVTYCYDVGQDFHARLMASFLDPNTAVGQTDRKITLEVTTDDHSDTR